jgi:hypothetical protein
MVAGDRGEPAHRGLRRPVAGLQPLANHLLRNSFGSETRSTKADGYGGGVPADNIGFAHLGPEHNDSRVNLRPKIGHRVRKLQAPGRQGHPPSGRLNLNQRAPPGQNCSKDTGTRPLTFHFRTS